MSALLTPPSTTATRLSLVWPRLRRPAANGRTCVLILLALCGVLFFYGLNLGEVWGTESLRAIVGAEMLRSGDWLVPRLYGVPLLSKPPGMYVAITLCSLPFGAVTEFSARLPSALAAMGTVFLVYWYFGRQLGRRGGFVAALMLPLSPLWLEKASTADIDMLQVFWTTAAILCWLRGLEEEPANVSASAQKGQSPGLANPASSASLTNARSPAPLLPCFPARPWWLLALLCVAGGFLTKWTTPAFFYATVLPLFWWRGQLRLLWSAKHLAAAGLAATICLTWLAAVIAVVGWSTVAATLEQEALQRLVPTYWGRPYPWGQTLLHPLKVMLVALPFSVLALGTLLPGFSRLWDERGQRLLQALHCWTWPNLLLWSLPTEHKAHYSFPLLPGLSGLAALVMIAWLARASRAAHAVSGLTSHPLISVRGSFKRGRWPKLLLIGTLAIWIVIKIAFAHGWIDGRGFGRPARARGELLARLVPPDCVLYLFGIKDEALLFYYGRQALALKTPDDLPADHRPVYCLFPEGVAKGGRPTKNLEVIETIKDGQSGSMCLVRVTAP